MSVEKYDSISREVGPSRAVKDTICVYARKEYASVEDMCAGSPMFFVDEQAGADGSLDKEFRWFYTDYVFTEKFSSVADYFKVPVTDFMSEEEALVQTDLLGHDFYVFTNATTGLVNVIYHRKNGGYGIIKPKVEENPDA